MRVGPEGSAHLLARRRPGRDHPVQRTHGREVRRRRQQPVAGPADDDDLLYPPIAAAPGRLENPAWPVNSRLILGSFVALLMLMTAFPHMTKSYNPIASLPYWDGEYWEAVSVAKALPGKVICPEDPTIRALRQGIRRAECQPGERHPPAQWILAGPPARSDAGRDPRRGPRRGRLSLPRGSTMQLLVKLGFEPVAQLPLTPDVTRCGGVSRSDIGHGLKPYRVQRVSDRANPAWPAGKIVPARFAMRIMERGKSPIPFSR